MLIGLVHVAINQYVRVEPWIDERDRRQHSAPRFVHELRERSNMWRRERTENLGVGLVGEVVSPTDPGSIEQVKDGASNGLITGGQRRHSLVTGDVAKRGRRQLGGAIREGGARNRREVSIV